MSCDRCARQAAGAGVLAASSGQTQAIFAREDTGPTPQCPHCGAWYNPAESCQNPRCPTNRGERLHSATFSRTAASPPDDTAVLDNYLIPDDREDLLRNEFLERMYSDMATAVARSPRQVHLAGADKPVSFATDMKGNIYAHAYPLGTAVPPAHNVVVTKGGIYHEFAHEEFTDQQTWFQIVSIGQSKKPLAFDVTGQRVRPEKKEEYIVGVDRLRPLVPQIFNIIEDGRIERELSRKYPGAGEILAASCRLDPRWDEAVGESIPPHGQLMGAMLYTSLPYYQVRPEVETRLHPKAKAVYDEVAPIIRRAVNGDQKDVYEATLIIADIMEQSGIVPTGSERPPSGIRATPPSGAPPPVIPPEELPGYTEHEPTRDEAHSDAPENETDNVTGSDDSGKEQDGADSPAAGSSDEGEGMESSSSGQADNATDEREGDHLAEDSTGHRSEDSPEDFPADLAEGSPDGDGPSDDSSGEGDSSSPAAADQDESVPESEAGSADSTSDAPEEFGQSDGENEDSGEAAGADHDSGKNRPFSSGGTPPDAEPETTDAADIDGDKPSEDLDEDEFAPLSDEDLDDVAQKAAHEAADAIRTGRRKKYSDKTLAADLHRPRQPHKSPQRWDKADSDWKIDLAPVVYRDSDGNVQETNTWVQTVGKGLAERTRKRAADLRADARQMAKYLSTVRHEVEKTLSHQREGRLDRRRFVDAVKGSRDIRTQTGKVMDTSLAASINFDLSGSMGSHVSNGSVVDTTLTLGAAFEELSVDYEVRGFAMGYSGEENLLVKSMDESQMDMGRVGRLYSNYNLGSYENAGIAAGIAATSLRGAESSNRLLVMMTDGALQPHDHAQAVKELAAARKEGVVTFGLFLNPRNETEFYNFYTEKQVNVQEMMDDLYGPGNWASITSLSEMPMKVGKRIANIFAKLGARRR